MIFIDSNIAILKDSSIIIFKDDGSTEFFMADGWKKRHQKPMKYENKETAIKIWKEVDKQLKIENQN